jgi:hypothetical protein
LLGARLGIGLASLTESLTRYFEGGLVNLATTLDDVDGPVLALLLKVVICLLPWFQPIAVVQQWKALTKMMVWLGVLAKPMVSALLLSALHPWSKMAYPLFVE